MSSTAVASYRPSARFALFVVIAGVASVAILGLSLAVSGLALQSQALPGIGDRVGTSFGVVAVSDIHARSASHTAGQGHSGHFTGPGSIPEGKLAVEVSVSLENTTDHGVTYSPNAFLLRLGTSGSVVGHSEATFFRGSLLPGGVLVGQLTFLVPGDGATGVLRFADPGRTDPIEIQLGTLSETAAGSGEGHNH
jgi:hypothetical protein